MANTSWDNGGGAPEKKKLGTGMKVLMGCGVAMLLAVVTCAVGGVLLSRTIKQDPEAFKKRVENWGQGYLQKDWDRLRVVVEQLQTDAGSRTVYTATQEFQQIYKTDTLFCATVRGWRPQLLPLPAKVPLDISHRPQGPDGAGERAETLNINKVFGTTTIKYRYPSGARVSATFSGDRLTRFYVD